MLPTSESPSLLQRFDIAFDILHTVVEPFQVLLLLHGEKLSLHMLQLLFQLSQLKVMAFILSTSTPNPSPVCSNIAFLIIMRGAF